MFYIRANAFKFDEVIEDFEYYNKNFDPEDNNRPEVKEQMDEIYYWQRIFFLAEGMSIFALSVFSIIVNLATSVQPLMSNRELPYHCIFPFGLHHRDVNPVSHVIIYVWLCLTIIYNMLCIVNIEIIGLHSIVETALNLKILGIEMTILGKLKNISDAEYHKRLLKIIKFHQHIIESVETLSRISYVSFIIQFVVSNTLISTATFMTLVTIDNPKVAFKFFTLGLILLIQLSYWCLTGSFVEIESVNVAQTAFNMDDWHTKPICMQREIMFLIMRAQKPLVYVASPLPPYTIATYLVLLKQCYTFLTLMRNTI